MRGLSSPKRKDVREREIRATGGRFFKLDVKEKISNAFNLLSFLYILYAS
jgi:hypothetical protein